MSRSTYWNRQAILGISLLCLSMIVLGFSLSHWVTINREWISAADDLELCQRLTRDIHGLQNQPRIASLEVESPQQTIERVTAAQVQSQLASDSLASVSPALPTRFGTTAYQTRNTELILQHVTLAQLHQFAAAMNDNDQGLVVRELSMTPAPTERADASNSVERWNVRLVLTQLIYSPTSNAAQ
jgi:hypothetical protein